MLQWMRKNYLKTFTAIVIAEILLSAVFYFISPGTVLAQTSTGDLSNVQEGVQVIEEPLGLPATDIRVIVANIIKYALGLLGLITLVMMLYGGFMWMTAGGNEEQIAQAKKILVNAVIGLAIILSAYAIVIFVSRLLGIGAGGGGGGGGGNLEAPLMENFSGSGALGGIIKDHYPARNQTDVPRNTKIVITFRKPIMPESFIEDSATTGLIGKCSTSMQNWYNDCDRVKTAAGGVLDDQYISIKDASTSAPIAAAVALTDVTTINGITGYYTVVIKPITDTNVDSGGYLGSSVENVTYKVRLGPGIKLMDAANGNPSVFQTSAAGNDYYEWQFTCGTSIDTTPPKVENVFPQDGVTEVKNTVVQINFSEPMDPIGMQGNFIDNSGDPTSFALENGSVYLKIGNSRIPAGSFNLNNGYRTLEFTPSQECGTNACGGKIYCLPVCDKPAATCKIDDYKMLLRAGKTINAASFEAQPLSGVMDLSGNALDSEPYGTVQTSTNSQVFDEQKEPDNYFWGFNINDEIDATSPYINKVVPGLDAANIPRDQEWSVVFSKRMRVEPLYDIAIQEKPEHEIPICHVPFTTFSTNTTYTRFSHCPFLDGIRQYYYPVVTSTVQDVHFNCFYPGKGPNQPAPDKLNSPECGPAAPLQCCDVVTVQNSDFCCNGEVTGDRANTQACVDYLKSQSL
jgi:hypothetical protein